MDSILNIADIFGIKLDTDILFDEVAEINRRRNDFIGEKLPLGQLWVKIIDGLKIGDY